MLHQYKCVYIAIQHKYNVAKYDNVCASQRLCFASILRCFAADRFAATTVDLTLHVMSVICNSAKIHKHTNTHLTDLHPIMSTFPCMSFRNTTIAMQYKPGILMLDKCHAKLQMPYKWHSNGVKIAFNSTLYVDERESFAIHTN